VACKQSIDCEWVEWSVKIEFDQFNNNNRTTLMSFEANSFKILRPFETADAQTNCELTI
jgi:hypothetical protein